MYFFSILLNFMDAESAFYFLEKLFAKVSYIEITEKEFLKEENAFIIKNLLNSKIIAQKDIKNLDKIVQTLFQIFYLGFFFHPNLEFQCSFSLFEKFLEKPSVNFFIWYETKAFS